MLNKLLAVAGASALLMASALGAARAADLPLKAAPAPGPVYSWTGFYAGLNGGYGLAEDPFSQTLTGGGLTNPPPSILGLPPMAGYSAGNSATTTSPAMPCLAWKETFSGAASGIPRDADLNA